MADHTNNYTIGRGKIYLARETVFDTFDRVGERYVGNSPGFTLNVESTSLDHFSSDAGINELDFSATTQVNRSGSVMFDDMSMDNMELFFLGQKSTVSQVATPVAAEIHLAVLPGLYYQLGVSQLTPQGVRGVTAVAVTSSPGATAYDLNEDYEVDADTGRIYIVPGGAITAGTGISVAYTPVASTRDRVVSGTRPVRGRMRYIEDNPAGENRTFLLPLVEISPNGDFDLKGDAWRMLTFNIKALKRGSMASVYIDGQPAP